jgi:preprotein translocase subunit SecD
VDALGISEPQIQEYGLGDNQVLVDLPGVENESQIERIIQGTNRLEIHAVVGGPYKDEQEAAASVGGSIPADQELKKFSGMVEGGNNEEGVYVLQRASVVAGNDFRSADPGTNQNTGQRMVEFTLTNEAGDKFYDYTSKNIGRSMAVVMNDRVREVAVIKGAIRDRARSKAPSRRTKLRRFPSCCAPARCRPRCSKWRSARWARRWARIRFAKGYGGHRGRAGGDGLHALLLPRLGHQRRSGADSEPGDSAGIHGLSGASLTLPGIAGVILTIGMGVDSNVLIFERIREEVRAGKAPSAAVDQGFAHAWVTIVDTHVTTIVSAAILFMFGTGPVKGFATLP